MEIFIQTKYTKYKQIINLGSVLVIYQCANLAMSNVHWMGEICTKTLQK